MRRYARELSTGRRPSLPGAVRASLGLGTTAADVDSLIGALHELAAHGPRGSYRYEPALDEYRYAGARLRPLRAAAAS